MLWFSTVIIKNQNNLVHLSLCQRQVSCFIKKAVESPHFRMISGLILLRGKEKEMGEVLPDGFSIDGEIHIGFLLNAACTESLSVRSYPFLKRSLVQSVGFGFAITHQSVVV